MKEEIQNQKEPVGYFGIVVRALIGFISLVALGVAVLMLFSGNWYLAELVNSFRLQVSLGLLGLALMLWYCGFRKWGMGQGLFALFLLYPVLSAMIPQRQPDAGVEPISLLSFNVLGTNIDQQPSLELLRDSGADILVVLEYENNWVETLNELEHTYAYSIEQPRWHGFGIALFSRHRIVDSEIHALTKNRTDNVFVVAYIDVRGQEIAVCGCHFLAPMSESRSDIRNDQIKEAAAIIQRIRSERGTPVVLVGDYNTVPWSSFTHDLRQVAGLRDSRQGYFYHGSWPSGGSLLSIPIDNAFVSPEIHVHDRSILKTTNSDHFPLSLKFSFKQQATPNEKQIDISVQTEPDSSEVP